LRQLHPWKHHVKVLNERRGEQKRGNPLCTLQVLKILRYSARLALATALSGSDANRDLVAALSQFESSVGNSRKAYRLGKFLGNANAMRKLPVRAPYVLLELLANAGECCYYFLEQVQWLARSGVLPPRLAPRVTRLSACGELVGYAASIILNTVRIRSIVEREVALGAELRRRLAVSGTADDEKNKPLAAEIAQLRARRVLRTLGLVQDLADSLLALADIRQAAPGQQQRAGLLSNRAVLAAAGLLSGCLSAYKQWPTTVR
jgi:hypothetical protein